MSAPKVEGFCPGWQGCPDHVENSMVACRVLLEPCFNKPGDCPGITALKTTVQDKGHLKRADREFQRYSLVQFANPNHEDTGQADQGFNGITRLLFGNPNRGGTGLKKDAGFHKGRSP